MAETSTVVRSVQAIARCHSCDWCASMTGDTQNEVEFFLRALLMEHVTRVHATGRPS